MLLHLAGDGTAALPELALGRREGSQGYEDTEATKVPGEIDAQRAREIMEAIRKRLSQPVSPRIEKDYLERLLEPE